VSSVSTLRSAAIFGRSSAGVLNRDTAERSERSADSHSQLGDDGIGQCEPQEIIGVRTLQILEGSTATFRNALAPTAAEGESWLSGRMVR